MPVEEVRGVVLALDAFEAGIMISPISTLPVALEKIRLRSVSARARNEGADRRHRGFHARGFLPALLDIGLMAGDPGQAGGPSAAQMRSANESRTSGFIAVSPVERRA